MIRAIALTAALAGVAHADRGKTRLRYTDAAIARIATSCAKGKHWYCRAATWDTGVDAPLPDKPLIGRWISIGEPGQKTRRTGRIDEQSDVVAMTFGNGRVVLETLTTHDNERATVTRALEKGSGPPVLTDGLRDQLDALRPEYAVTGVDGEWFYDERSDDVRIRFVDGVWIAILSPPPAAARSYPDARLVYVLRPLD